MTRRTLLLLVPLLLVPYAARAHEGHTHKTMGVVTRMDDDQLEIKDLKGKATTFTLSAKTRVRRAKAILKPSDIKVGDRVVVVTLETKNKATGKSTIAVTEVQLGTARATL